MQKKIKAAKREKEAESGKLDEVEERSETATISSVPTGNEEVSYSGAVQGLLAGAGAEGAASKPWSEEAERGESSVRGQG